MKLSRPDADIFTPDGSDPAKALARTTHLCVTAHQDDIEIMAYPGIAACHGSGEHWFTGVVVTDGAESGDNGWTAQGWKVSTGTESATTPAAPSEDTYRTFKPRAKHALPMACNRWVLPSPTPLYMKSGLYALPGASATALAEA